MRASRLLHMLLLLQNRGRLTCAALADELEVTRRTVLRDVDALTEAGLPVVVVRGSKGGIELGFNYRTRLTGLAADEAEALGVLLAQPSEAIGALGLGAAAARARRKLLESLPDTVRGRAEQAGRRFPLGGSSASSSADPRIEALATAVREARIVRLQAYQPGERVVHPIVLGRDDRGWWLEDQLATGTRIRQHEWGAINISARCFVACSL